MQNLLSERSWELAVLCKSVSYPNLSAAANHVGLSQPQLSRIIARLEADLGIVLLDRSVRRKSGWTPMAERLAETFTRSSRHLDAEIQALIGNAEPRHLSIGTLEGLVPIASIFAHQIFEQSTVRVIDLNVYDLNQLEELFLKNELNLIFSIREPGRRKFRHRRHLGHQSLEVEEHAGEPCTVMSSFEFSSGTLKAPDGGRVLVSNSLAVRRGWLTRHGGTGLVPGEVRKTKKEQGSESSDDRGIHLIADDLLSENLWKKILTFDF